LLPTEDALGPELGVSRSVLREAVKVLVGKGLLEVRPKTGTRVRPRRSWHLFDPDVVRWQFEQLGDYHVRELAEIRSTVEPAAARLAAERRTDGDVAGLEAHYKRMDSAVAEPIAFRRAELDFHAAVLDSAHNTLLSHMGAIIRVALTSALEGRAASIATNSLGTDHHRTILDAIREQDAAAAEQAMRVLLDQWWADFSQPPGRSSTGSARNSGEPDPTAGRAP
jgi:DNA-binding FadR family transcriptional regulator